MNHSTTRPSNQVKFMEIQDKILAKSTEETSLGLSWAKNWDELEKLRKKGILNSFQVCDLMNKLTSEINNKFDVIEAEKAALRTLQKEFI